MEQVYKERIKLWVDALRSGKFDQTQQFLGRPGVDGGKDQMCCLGVACEVAIEAGLPVERKLTTGIVTRFAYGCDGYTDDKELPWPVAQWFGLTSGNPVLRAKWGLIDPRSFASAVDVEPGGTVGAAGCNDIYRLSLPQIADLVEYTYLQDEGDTKEEQ